MNVASVLRVFRRHMMWLKLLRWMGLAAIVAGVFGALGLTHPQHRSLCITLLGALMVGWMLLILRSVRLTREIRAGSLLLGLGRLDDAEVWLRRAITTFSLFKPSKLVAGEMWALLLMQRGRYEDVIDVCREMLRHRLRRMHAVWVNTRLLLADSLLLLGRVGEARQAILPLSLEPLTLEGRMKLLPTQLRCELSSGESAASVAGLAEKVRVAELMESPRAALVHALLAEACRQQGMHCEHSFLAERAQLYHDLAAMADPIPGTAQIPAPDEPT